MPAFTSSFSDSFKRATGCQIEMELGVDRVTEKYLRDKGLPVPAPARIPALLDPGVSVTCIDSSYINQLALKSRDYIKCRTASGTRQAAVCAVRIRLPLDDIPWEADYHPCAIFTHLASGGFGALIGLDILSRFQFKLEGPQGRFRLLLPELESIAPPAPAIEGTSYFDPECDCFRRYVGGKWQEYHAGPPPGTGLLARLKNGWGRHTA